MLELEGHNFEINIDYCDGVSVFSAQELKCVIIKGGNTTLERDGQGCEL